MRIFFLSEKTGGLTVNGIYLGLVDGFERSVELEIEDGLLCTLSVPGCLPLSFRLDGDFLLNPPPQVAIYRTRRGIAVWMKDFCASDQTLTVLWQKRVNGCLLTLTRQGRLQLNFQSDSRFCVLPLPDRLSECEAYPCGGEILLESPNAFLLLSAEGEILADSEGRVEERGEVLRAEVPFHDAAGHTARMAWERGKLVSCSIRTRREPTEATVALCLFESVLIGADPAPYLDGSLSGKADMLREFLGKFCSVVLTEEPDLTGLVYEVRPRVFEVRYFRVTLTDGKVSNFAEV